MLTALRWFRYARSQRPSATRFPGTGRTNTVILKKGETPINIQLGKDRYHAGNDRTGGVSLGAASYEVDGTSWVPAELFQLAGETLSFANGSLVLGTMVQPAV